MVCFNLRLRDERRRKRIASSHGRPSRRSRGPSEGKDRALRGKAERRRRTPQGLQALRDPVRGRRSLLEPPAGPDRPRGGARRTLGRPHQPDCIGADEAVAAYKSLSQVEQAFPEDPADLRLCRSPRRLPVHARLPRRMAHEKDGSPRSCSTRTIRKPPGRSAPRRSSPPSPPPRPEPRPRAKTRAGRDGRAQLPYLARRSFDRRSERRLHRRFRKLQTGHETDTRTTKGIRSPRRQSEEHVPKS